MTNKRADIDEQLINDRFTRYKSLDKNPNRIKNHRQHFT